MNINNNTKFKGKKFFSSILQQLPGFIMLMDTESRFIYSNQYTANLLGYKNVDQLLGDNAYDIHCDAAVCAPDFLKQDAYVRENLTTLTMLEIHNYANDQQKILLAKKSPFFLENQLIGTTNYFVSVDSTYLERLSSYLFNSDKYFNKSKERIYTVDTLIFDGMLNKSELDCIFYLLRGAKLKHIEKVLGLTCKMVESYLASIKEKWKCSNKAQLIDFGVSNGYLNYIPLNYLTGLLA